MSPANKKQVRVRIAPSPTGYMHIGTVRTALFNWLYAKQNGGVFVLRIEDTDLERSKKEYEEDLIDNLKWIGLTWDEGPLAGAQVESEKLKVKSYAGEYGPYRQTERLDIYEKHLAGLLKDSRAYYCFCSKDQLEEERQAMLAQGFAPKYSGRCRTLNIEESAERVKKGEESVIRLKVADKKISFKDMIRGEVAFESSLIGDFVIAKSLRSPLYNFAVVVDDEDMKISHVIRGEEHLANTPRQLLIQEALGFSQPYYAHIPLILNADRSKMSKRAGDTAIRDYRTQGYLPEAILNFLVMLGWHPKDDKEIFTIEELIKEFDIARIQKGGAIFNVDKLDWINAQYIKAMDIKALAELLNVKPTEQNLKIVENTKERMRKLTDFQALAGFYVELPEYKPELLIWKTSTKEKTLVNLKDAEQLISAITSDDFSKGKIEKVLMPVAEARGKGDMLWPLRVAVSGSEKSPGPFEIMEVIGKKETLVRVAVAIQRLSSYLKINSS
ncbi:MAG: glutamate--tRNA ligase [bacterium]|nr:glutamate--tRNA ligase [bacterium]